ncbi:MAG: DUF2029 domain-containing protein [Candidatus Rokubacteria bacterium]|nr:DUF2029 domain-containing protein [Candidatus Rokubacteria bacterium]
MLLAGLVGWLTPSGVVVMAVLALAAVTWRLRPARPDAGATPRFSLVAALPPATAVIVGIVWASPHVVDATRLWIWDDYTYHMVYPALWLRDHALGAVPPEHAFTMQAWYPLSASLVATWFMVPFAASRGDALAWVSLTGVLYAAVVATGAAELLARVGCRRGAWAVPLVLFATSHRVGVMASSFSDADLAPAAVLFAALVFAIPRADETEREARVDRWYAALLSGLAVGMKVSAAPAAFVVFVLVAWRAGAPGARRRAAAHVALVFTVAWIATGGYWYIRNVVHTGNPFYPAAFLGWAGTTFPHTTLREYAREYGVARAIGDALDVYLDWPRLHAWVAIVGLAGLAGWLLARRHAITRPQAFLAAGALAITAVTLLLLPSTPYSAGNGMTFVSGFIHWDSMRYVALLPILGWVALGFLIDAGAGTPIRRTVLAGVVALAALVASQLSWRDVVVVLVAAAIVAAVSRRRHWRPIGCAAKSVTAAATLLAAVIFVAATHGTKAAATSAGIHREPLFGAAAAVLDRQVPGTRIAVYGDQWIYPTFGARHDLVPVRLTGDGEIATMPVADAMTPGPLNVHPYRFRVNLAAAKIGIVVVVHLPHPGRSPQWPSQAAALEMVGGARLIYRDRAVGIWRLTD